MKEEKNKYDQQSDKLIDLKEKIIKYKEKNKEKEENENNCCICMNRDSDYACFPCGHKKYCRICLNNINVCSVCKNPIESRVEIQN